MNSPDEVTLDPVYVDILQGMHAIPPHQILELTSLNRSEGNESS